jgi:hypothetical protein
MASCALAWIFLLSTMQQHTSHAHHGGTFTGQMVEWVVMVGAMMLPLTRFNLRFVALGSLWARRNRAMMLFLLGYFSPWVILGAILSLLTFRLEFMEGWAAGAFLFALLWQGTRWHRRALTACHQTRPLAPTGPRADLDCLLYGSAVGCACVRTCWVYMLACLFTRHNIAVMLGGMVASSLERWPRRPRRRMATLATLVSALSYFLTAQLTRSATMMP